MNYTYLGYTGDRQIVKGRISAADERAAADMLSNIGYRVVSLKPSYYLFSPNLGGFFQAKVKTAEMVTFSRQLALFWNQVSASSRLWSCSDPRQQTEP